MRCGKAPPYADPDTDGSLNNGFLLNAVKEARPPEEMMEIPGMKDELRRPMMLLVKASVKK